MVYNIDDRWNSTGENCQACYRAILNAEFVVKVFNNCGQEGLVHLECIENPTRNEDD